MKREYEEKVRMLSDLMFIMGDEEAMVWLFTPHKSLHRDTPAEAVLEGEVDVVLTLIDQMETGAFL